MNNEEVIQIESSVEREGLFKKDFTLVIIGQIISLFGNAILRFALPLYILDMSKSPSLFGLVSASAFLPMILMAPIGGIVADRVNKQKIMVALDFFTGILIVGFILLKGVFSIVPLVVIVLMILYGIQGAYAPAVQASIPALLQKDQLVSGNAVVTMVTSLSGLLGPVLGGLLYGTYGLKPILVVSVACFIFSGILELFIKIPYVKQISKGSIGKIVKGDIKESVHFIVKEKPVLLKIIVIIFLFNLFLSSMLIIGFPVIITQSLGLSSELYGVSQGFLATGGILGGVLAGFFGRKLIIKKASIWLLLCAFTAIPMGLALLSSASSFTIYVILTAMSFFCMMFSNIFVIQLIAFVQEKTPAQLTGKVISLLVAVSLCAQPLGQSLYGFLFEWFSKDLWMVVLSASAVAMGISFYSKRIFNKFL